MSDPKPSMTKAIRTLPQQRSCPMPSWDAADFGELGRPGDSG
jgi:hypothetical protein